MQIDKTTARHLLRELEVDHWLTAGMSYSPKTFVTQNLRSLPQLEMLLRPNGKYYPSLHLGKMTEWVRLSVGDEVLARQLEAVCDSGKSYYEQCLACHALIQERCEILRRAAEVEDA